MLPGSWKNALIDIDRSTEFTGDDVDRYSQVVDLGGAFEYLAVFIPTIDSAQITPYVQRDSHVDKVTNANGTVPVPVHFFNDSDADTDVVQSTVAGTGGIFVVFHIGSAQFVRIHSGANQTADRTFVIRGYNRN